MSTLVVSPRARADLRGIWRYTRDHWGAAQADRYIHEINRALAILAANPERGRSCEEIRRGYRKYRIGAHMIFFRVVPEGIEIVRVLHQSMDFTRHV
jgi:toxin ParE1/3/4